MPQFMFAYHGGKMPDTPEEKAALMARWKAWIEGLGDALVNPGGPFGKSKTVSVAGVADDGGANPLSGFSVIEADSMDAAIAMGKSCPHIESGTIEVAEIIQMQ